MVKYQVQHDSVRRYVPKEFQELADSFINHLGNFMDKITVRDVIYGATYVAAVIRIYELTSHLHFPLKYIPGLGMIFPGIALEAMKETGLYPEEEKEEEKINWAVLCESMIAAYMLLKIDVSDVAGAISAISGIVAKVGM